MRKSDRERRRIATIKKNNGDDFFSRNGRHAAQFNRTKFNSKTGRAAALKMHEMEREKRAKKLRESQEESDVQNL